VTQCASYEPEYGCGRVGQGSRSAPSRRDLNERTPANLKKLLAFALAVSVTLKKDEEPSFSLRSVVTRTGVPAARLFCFSRQSDGRGCLYAIKENDWANDTGL
jgi:hypothetical protein